jgi:hypothetical protein
MKKSSVWVAVVMTASLLTCSACTKHDFPSCNDEQVKNIVLEKATEITKDLYLGHATPADLGLKQAKGAYGVLKERMEKKDEPRREEIRKLLVSADAVITKMTVELTDIKQTDRNEKSGTTACTGTLTFTSKETKKKSSASIAFTAKFVEGHKLNVELTRF